jgi:transcriptional regulator with XRE-family HTH domain
MTDGIAGVDGGRQSLRYRTARESADTNGRGDHVTTSDEEQRQRRAARFLMLPSTGKSRQLRERLRAARERKGMTLEQVADQIAEYLGLDSFSAASVSHYEQFRRHPPVDVMAAWSRSVGMVLRVELDDADSERVQVLLRPDVARLARGMEAVSPEDLRAIEAVLSRFVPLDPAS